jgi:ANTAR domain
VIVDDQAMGMLMLRYGLHPDSAFLLLTKVSQESNVKVRNLADRVVANAAAGGSLLENVADRVDTLLRRGSMNQHASQSGSGRSVTA